MHDRKRGAHLRRRNRPEARLDRARQVCHLVILNSNPLADIDRVVKNGVVYPAVDLVAP